MLWFKFTSNSNFFKLVHIFQTGSYFSNQFIFFKLVQFIKLVHIFVDTLGKHPLCHRMCKVTKETSGANNIMRNAIDSTSIAFRWTLSSSQQSVFSTTTIAKKTEENGSQSRKSDYLVKIGPWTSEPLLG